MKEKLPRVYAFCWLHGIELNSGMLKDKQCNNPCKQLAEDGKCKHIQFYGDKKARMY